MNLISGWGLHNPANVRIIKPNKFEQLENIIVNSNKNSLLARGLGRSYGDAAQLKNESVFSLHDFDHIYLNKKEGFITAGSGVSIDSLLKKIIPEGFFIPVSPGTRNVTIGGAIASDVHGKNHHLNGSFGNHIKEILLIDGLGNLKKLSSNNNETIEIKNQFWATIGGMGLTGVIIEATFSLIPIKTSKMKANTYKYKDLDDLMDAMTNSQDNYQYIVAWVDSLSQKNRGVLTVGNHADDNDLLKKDPNKNILSYHSKSIASAPSILPFRLLNKFTVKAFNEVWYRKTPKEQKDEIKSISNFFHPLDGIKNWNKFYGSKGFIQYQFVVPENEYKTIFEILEITKKISTPSFLTVLKKFGPGNKAFLSFPIKGWTLAIDFPLYLSNLNQTLLKLDEKVLSAGGRIYLAKDSMQSSEMFKSTYPRLNEWKEVKSKMDPKNIFCSDLSKRLNIF
ncbi:FAD-binding oxidoreductase [uncultured Prochlorococcus sp.]|uniref:FAD-binding oxidoreductase n=1 Tax=uncultured Prochlorococcus sp. TaxID=159733 RepID=UPI002585723D|nr:FAD-binding oxidoreductase [uncultured Prochlorococcus sp.]